MSHEAAAWAMAQETGHATRKAVLMILANMATPDGVVHRCTQTVLAKVCELSERQLRNVLDKLIASGLVRRTRHSSTLGREPDALVLAILPEVIAPIAGCKGDKQPAIGNDCRLQGAQATGNRQLQAGQKLPVACPPSNRQSATGNPGEALSSPLTPPLVPPLLSSPTPPSNNPPYNPPQSTPQQTPGKPAESGLFAAEELPGTDPASKPKPKRARSAYTPEFEAFWKSWPQTRRERSDKQTAFRRWSDGVERWGVDAIMAAAKRYLSKPDTRKDGWRFCVLAEVFLNGKLEAAVEAALEAQAKAGGSATTGAANATSDDAEARKWARRYEGWCENPNIWAVAWGDKPDDPRHKGPGLDAVRHLMTPNPTA